MLVTGGTGVIGAEVARLLFVPDPELQALVGQLGRPIGDRSAQSEWSWQPAYGLEATVDDFFQELRQHPERYSA